MTSPNPDTRHTPGPWHVRHCSGTIAVRGKRGVCVVHWHGPKDGEPHMRAIADANLIAVAPDFAEIAPDAADLLERYAAFIRENVKADDLEMHPYLPEVERVAEALRAALAKATPENPS